MFASKSNDFRTAAAAAAAAASAAAAAAAAAASAATAAAAARNAGKEPVDEHYGCAMGRDRTGVRFYVGCNRRAYDV